MPKGVQFAARPSSSTARARPKAASSATASTFFCSFRKTAASCRVAASFPGAPGVPPQGRDLNVFRVHRRWGMVNIPKVGRVRFRWAKDLPVGKQADGENRITGARLIKDALGWHVAFRVQSLEAKPPPA